MDDSRLPQKLLVCAPAGGSRSAGSQSRRWCGLVTRDLKVCELEEDWRELALDWRAWRCFVQEAVEELNQRLEQEEVKRKDELKARQERQQDTALEALRCTYPDCGFTAVTPAGLSNHHRQRHQPSNLVQSTHCGRNFRRQGTHNHQKFCSSKPA